jgi:hypothetical protein
MHAGAHRTPSCAVKASKVTESLIFFGEYQYIRSNQYCKQHKQHPPRALQGYHVVSFLFYPFLPLSIDLRVSRGTKHVTNNGQ